MAQMDFSAAELFLKGEDPDANGRKMSPNVCYEWGSMTALHMAALNDDIEGVRLLLKYGADKEFKSDEGQTALDMAKEQNSKGVIALLIDE
jgi:ankyrin repeat protein